MKLHLILDRFENDKAILIAADGTSLVWSKDKLPQNAREGSALNFDILEDKERQEKDQQTAKAIINEIINQS